MKTLNEKELQQLQEENSKKLKRCSIANLEFEKAVREWEIDIDEYNKEQQAENERMGQKFDETNYILSFLNLPF